MNDTAFLKVLETATKDEPQDNRELMLWQSQILRDPSSLPHPIEFNSNTDLRWLKLYRKQYKCKRAASGKSIDSIELTQRLFVGIRSNATKLGIAIETGCLPSTGTPPQQAAEIAISAYNSRKNRKR